MPPQEGSNARCSRAETRVCWWYVMCGQCGGIWKHLEAQSFGHERSAR